MEWQGRERRKAHDAWYYLARVLAIAGWVIFIIALIISFYAAPDDDYGLLRYHGIAIRKFWLTPLTGYLYIMLWFSALSSYIYLILERYRRRRKTDSKHFNVALLLLITIAWVVYILFQFR